jgi:hypothetical protein
MSRVKAVELLIERHRDLALEYNNIAQKHLAISKDLERYRYELTKPGFKTLGWTRHGKPSRTEPYVVQAHEGTIGSAG